MGTDEATWPFSGRIVWLTPAQGGRQSGPPIPWDDRGYRHNAYVPPRTLADGLASFALRGFAASAWRSTAEGRWLIVENAGVYRIHPGTVVVCTEGPTVIGYFHVESVGA